MTLPRIAILTGILVLFLATCSPNPDIVQRMRELPGAHVAWAAEAPAGFERRTPAQTIALHDAGQDIWLFVPAAALTAVDSDGALAAWLAVQNAVRFLNADLYWIPAQTQIDHLSFLESHDLLDTVDTTQSAHLWRLRGDQLRLQNDFEDAVSAYRSSLDSAPEDAEANAGLGAAYLGLGRGAEAVPPLQRAVAADPDHYWAHRLLGTSYLNLQRYALAADELTQAYLLVPDDPALLADIALAQGRSGQKELALRTLDQLEARSAEPSLLDIARTLRQEFSVP